MPTSLEPARKAFDVRKSLGEKECRRPLAGVAVVATDDGGVRLVRLRQELLDVLVGEVERPGDMAFPVGIGIADIDEERPPPVELDFGRRGVDLGDGLLRGHAGILPSFRIRAKITAGVYGNRLF